MKPERWQQIERLCHAALEVEEEQRAAFLEEACEGDATLRREVEHLLAQEDESGRLSRNSGPGSGSQSHGPGSGPTPWWGNSSAPTRLFPCWALAEWEKFTWLRTPA